MMALTFTDLILNREIPYSN